VEKAGRATIWSWVVLVAVAPMPFPLVLKFSPDKRLHRTFGASELLSIYDGWRLHEKTTTTFSTSIHFWVHYRLYGII